MPTITLRLNKHSLLAQRISRLSLLPNTLHQGAPMDQPPSDNRYIPLTPYSPPLEERHAPTDIRRARIAGPEKFRSAEDYTRAQENYYKSKAYEDVFGGKQPSYAALRLPEHNAAMKEGRLTEQQIRQVARHSEEVYSRGKEGDTAEQQMRLLARPEGGSSSWKILPQAGEHQTKEHYEQKLLATQSAIKAWYEETARNASRLAGKPITVEQIRKFIPNLSHEQLRAIQSPNPIAITTAGAGSGKSTLMRGQMIDDIVNRNADPTKYNIVSRTHSAIDSFTSGLKGIEDIIPTLTQKVIESQKRTLDSTALSLLNRRTGEQNGSRVIDKIFDGKVANYQPLLAGSKEAHRSIESEVEAQKKTIQVYLSKVMDQVGISRKVNNVRDASQYIEETKGNRYNGLYDQRMEAGKQQFQAGKWKTEEQGKQVDHDLLLYAYEQALKHRPGFRLPEQQTPLYDQHDAPYLVAQAVKQGHLPPVKRLIADEFQDASVNQTQMLIALTRAADSRAFYGGDMGQPALQQKERIDQILAQSYGENASTHTLTGNYRSGPYTVATMNSINALDVLEGKGKSPMQVAMGREDLPPTSTLATNHEQLYERMATDWMQRMNTSPRKIKSALELGESPFQDAPMLAQEAPLVFQMNELGRGKFRQVLQKMLTEKIGTEHTEKFFEQHYSEEPFKPENLDKMHALTIPQIRSREAKEVYFDVTRAGKWDPEGYAHNLYTGASRATEQNHFYASLSNVAGNSHDLTPASFLGQSVPPGFDHIFRGTAEDAFMTQGVAPERMPALYQDALNLPPQMYQQPIGDAPDQQALARYIEDVIMLSKHYQSPVGSGTGIHAQKDVATYDEEEGGKRSGGLKTRGTLNAAIVSGRYKKSGDVYGMQMIREQARNTLQNGTQDPIPEWSQFLDQTKKMIGPVDITHEDVDRFAFNDGRVTRTPFDPTTMQAAPTVIENHDNEQKDFAPREQHTSGGYDIQLIKQKIAQFAALEDVRQHPHMQSMLKQFNNHPDMLQRVQLVADKNERVPSLRRVSSLIAFAKTPVSVLQDELNGLHAKRERVPEEEKRVQELQRMLAMKKNGRGGAGAIDKIMQGVQDPQNEKLHNAILADIIQDKARYLLSQNPDQETLQRLFTIAKGIGLSHKHPEVRAQFMHFSDLFHAHIRNSKDTENGLSIDEQTLQHITKQDPVQGKMLENMLRDPKTSELRNMDHPDVYKAITQLSYNQGRVLRAIDTPEAGREMGVSLQASQNSPALTAMKAYASAIETSGLVDPMALQAIPLDTDSLERAKDDGFSYQQYGAGVPAGSLQKRLSDLLERSSHKIEPAARAPMLAQLREVRRARQLIHNPINQQSYAHTLSIIQRATTGESVMGGKGEIDPIRSLMGNQTQGMQEGTRTIEAFTSFVKALDQASEHVQKTGELKRSHILQVLHALGHSPEDKRFVGLHHLEEKGFVPTANTPDPSLSLKKLIGQFPGQQDNVHRQLTRIPLLPRTKYQFKGGMKGYRPINDHQRKAGITPEQVEGGIQGTLHSMRGKDQRLLPFGFASNIARHRSLNMFAGSEFMAQKAIPGNQSFEPILRFLGRDSEGKKVSMPVTPEQLALVNPKYMLPEEEQAQTNARAESQGRTHLSTQSSHELGWQKRITRDPAAKLERMNTHVSYPIGPYPPKSTSNIIPPLMVLNAKRIRANRQETLALQQDKQDRRSREEAQEEEKHLQEQLAWITPLLKGGSTDQEGGMPEWRRAEIYQTPADKAVLADQRQQEALDLHHDRQQLAWITPLLKEKGTISQLSLQNWQSPLFKNEQEALKKWSIPSPFVGKEEQGTNEHVLPKPSLEREAKREAKREEWLADPEMQYLIAQSGKRARDLDFDDLSRLRWENPAIMNRGRGENQPVLPSLPDPVTPVLLPEKQPIPSLTDLTPAPKLSKRERRQQQRMAKKTQDVLPSLAALAPPAFSEEAMYPAHDTSLPGLLSYAHANEVPRPGLPIKATPTAITPWEGGRFQDVLLPDRHTTDLLMAHAPALSPTRGESGGIVPYFTGTPRTGHTIVTEIPEMQQALPSGTHFPIQGLPMPRGFTMHAPDLPEKIEQRGSPIAGLLPSPTYKPPRYPIRLAPRPRPPTRSLSEIQSGPTLALPMPRGFTMRASPLPEQIELPGSPIAGLLPSPRPLRPRYPLRAFPPPLLLAERVEKPTGFTLVHDPLPEPPPPADLPPVMYHGAPAIAGLLPERAYKRGSALADPRLSQQQRQAITDSAHHMIIRGGPGSGKTSTAVDRMKELILSGKILPQNVLALSAMHSGVEALNEKFQKQVRPFLRKRNDPAFELRNAKTIHALSYDILFGNQTEEGRYPILEKMGKGHIKHILEDVSPEDQQQMNPQEHALLKTTSKKKFLEEALQQRFSPGAKMPKDYELEGMLTEIGKIKKGQGEDESGYQDAIKRGREDIAKGQVTNEAGLVTYEEAKEKEGLIDFNDMPVLARQALDQFGIHAVPQRLQGLQMIMNDEAQDTTPAGLGMIKSLAQATGARVQASMDPMQGLMENLGSIAPGKVVNSFLDVFKGTGKSYNDRELTKNFRSDRRTIALNNAFILSPFMKNVEGKSSPQTAGPDTQEGTPEQYHLAKSDVELYKKMFRSMLSSTGVAHETLKANIEAGEHPFTGVDWKAPGLTLPKEIPGIFTTKNRRDFFKHIGTETLKEDFGVSHGLATRGLNAMTRNGVPGMRQGDKIMEAAKTQFPIGTVGQFKGLEFLRPHVDVTRAGAWRHKDQLVSYVRNMLVAVSRTKASGQTHLFASSRPFNFWQQDAYKRGEPFVETEPNDPLHGTVELGLGKNRLVAPDKAGVTNFTHAENELLPNDVFAQITPIRNEQMRKMASPPQMAPPLSPSPPAASLPPVSPLPLTSPSMGIGPTPLSSPPTFVPPAILPSSPSPITASIHQTPSASPGVATPTMASIPSLSGVSSSDPIMVRKSTPPPSGYRTPLSLIRSAPLISPLHGLTQKDPKNSSLPKSSTDWQDTQQTSIPVPPSQVSPIRTPKSAMISSHEFDPDFLPKGPFGKSAKGYFDEDEWGQYSRKDVFPTIEGWKQHLETQKAKVHELLHSPTAIAEMQQPQIDLYKNALKNPRASALHYTNISKERVHRLDDELPPTTQKRSPQQVFEQKRWMNYQNLPGTPSKQGWKEHLEQGYNDIQDLAKAHPTDPEFSQSKASYEEALKHIDTSFSQFMPSQGFSPKNILEKVKRIITPSLTSYPPPPSLPSRAAKIPLSQGQQSVQPPHSTSSLPPGISSRGVASLKNYSQTIADAYKANPSNLSWENFLKKQKDFLVQNPESHPMMRQRRMEIIEQMLANPSKYSPTQTHIPVPPISHAPLGGVTPPPPATSAQGISSPRKSSSATPSSGGASSAQNVNINLPGGSINVGGNNPSININRGNTPSPSSFSPGTATPPSSGTATPPGASYNPFNARPSGGALAARPTFNTPGATPSNPQTIPITIPPIGVGGGGGSPPPDEKKKTENGDTKDSSKSLNFNNAASNTGRSLARIGSEMQFVGKLFDQITMDAAVQGSQYRRATGTLQGSGTDSTSGFFDFTNGGPIDSFQGRNLPMYSKVQIAQGMHDYAASQNTQQGLLSGTQDVLSLSALSGVDSQSLMGQLSNIAGTVGQGGNFTTNNQVSGMISSMYGGNLSAMNVTPTLSALSGVLPTMQGLSLGAGSQISPTMATFQTALNGGMTTQNLGDVSSALTGLAGIGSTPDLQGQAFLQQLYPHKQMTANSQYVEYQNQQTQQGQQLQQLQLQQNIGGGISLPHLEMQIDNATINMEKANLDMSSLQQANNQASFQFNLQQQDAQYGAIGADTSRNSYFSFMRNQQAAGYNPLSAETGTQFTKAPTAGLQNMEFYAGVEHQRQDMVLSRSPLLSDAKFQEDMKYLNEQEAFYQQELQLRNEQRIFEKTWTQKMLDQQAVTLTLQKQSFVLDQQRNTYELQNLALQEKFLPQQISSIQNLMAAQKQFMSGQGPVAGGNVTPQQILQTLAAIKDDKALKQTIASSRLPLDQQNTIFTIVKAMQKPGGSIAAQQQQQAASDAPLLATLQKLIGNGAFTDQKAIASMADAMLNFAGKGGSWDQFVKAFDNADQTWKNIGQLLSGWAPAMKNLATLLQILGPALVAIGTVLNVIGLAVTLLGGLGKFLGKLAGGGATETVTNAAEGALGTGGAEGAAGAGGMSAGAMVALPAAVAIGGGIAGWSQYSKSDYQGMTADKFINRTLPNSMINALVPSYGLAQNAHMWWDVAHGQGPSNIQKGVQQIGGAWNTVTNAKTWQNIGSGIQKTAGNWWDSFTKPQPSSYDPNAPAWANQTDANGRPYTPKPTPTAHGYRADIPSQTDIQDLIQKQGQGNQSGKNNWVQQASDYFTKTLPNWFNSTIGNYFTKTLPDWWNKNVGGFFGKTLPDWWNKNVAPFFTQYFPNWISQNIGGFFTKYFPNWINQNIGGFFSQYFPNWINQNIGTFFNKTFPNWISQNIGGFFTKYFPTFLNGSIGTFFTSIFPNWINQNIGGFFTKTFPTFLNQNIGVFFSKTFPNWLDQNIGTYFNKTLPAWWTTNVGTFFTKTLPDFFQKSLPQLLTSAIGKSLGGLNPFGGSTTGGGGGGMMPTSGAPAGFTTPNVNTEFGTKMWYGQHQGVDFNAAQGTPISEFVGGTVTNTGFFPWGGEIDVALPGGFTERYLHLSQINVRNGQSVGRGTHLGLTGGGTPQSGLGYWSHGAHSHVQIDRGNINAGVDPWPLWAIFGARNISSHYGGSSGTSGAGTTFGGAGGGTHGMSQAARTHLALGGIITHPQNIQMGELEAEAVIPLSKLGSVLQSLPLAQQASTTTTTTHAGMSIGNLIGTLHLNVGSGGKMNEAEQDELMSQLMDILTEAAKQFSGKLT